MNNSIKIEWIMIGKKEDKFLKNATAKKNSKFDKFLEDKILDKLQNTLDAAFKKSFQKGLPVVGVVGGLYDAVFINKILDYAKLKYHRRFLTSIN